MRVGIIGTRGIPNHYGGFEQFAEYFSVLLTEKGHDVSVYTSHKHPYQEKNYKGVKLIHCYDPEYKMGTAGQFFYDLNCIRNARKQNFDLILQLGYTSSTIWSWLYPKKSLLVTNMDGLEWSRQKYNKPTRYFLTFAEKWGVHYSDFLIADSVGIQQYLQQKFNKTSYFVPYGADVYEPEELDKELLRDYKVSAYNYDIAIARFEPENNLEIIADAYRQTPENALVLVGDYNKTPFGRYLYGKFSKHKNIIFAGAIFDMQKLNTLRYYSRLYLHGHSVGGTNPSLLEAMASHALICAHDNIFNRNVLGEEAFYFKNADDILALLSQKIDKEQYSCYLSGNHTKITDIYNWRNITNQLEELFNKWIHESRN